MRESRSPPPFNEEPQISKDFWGFFVFSSRGSFSSPLGLFFIVILHRISRMNRMAILLIGLLTDFRGYLAAGQWLAPEMGSYCFSHADFADDADFFSLIILVPQISRINTDFFHWLFFSWIYTDFLWFSSFPAISSFSLSFLLFPVISLFRRF